jgi:hypothetical protein
LEVAELQLTPTESLLRIRRKWEQQNPLARAEWIFLAKYIRVACEEISEDPTMPGHRALALVLESFLAVRALRADRGIGLDLYYLGNLGVPDGTSFIERQYDPQMVPQLVGELVEKLRQSSNRPKPTFAGRNLFVDLRDEALPDVIALNRMLEPFLQTLFRLAVRGHWIRECRPVRSKREASIRLLLPTGECACATCIVWARKTACGSERPGSATEWSSEPGAGKDPFSSFHVKSVRIVCGVRSILRVDSKTRLK